MPYPEISAYGAGIGGGRGDIGARPRITSVARVNRLVNLTQA